jgi:hypothetical protein
MKKQPKNYLRLSKSSKKSSNKRTLNSKRKRLDVESFKKSWPKWKKDLLWEVTSSKRRKETRPKHRESCSWNWKRRRKFSKSF